jgi:hypothetical protein
MKKISGTRFIAEIPQGSSWRIFAGRIIVAGPSHEPYYQNDDGTKEVIKPLPEQPDRDVPPESNA